VLLLDVTPLTLGIETLGGVMTKMIERNTTIPTRKAETYSTASDNQPSVEIKVYQGERAMAADNRLLGAFQLIGLPPAPRGLPQIEVTFDIDANGILNVKAKDKATGKEQAISITSSSGLSKEEVQKMAREAESHAAEDTRKREGIEARNRADTLVYSTEKLLKENREKVADSDAQAIESGIAELKKTIEGAPETYDASAINKAMEQLNQATHKLAEAMYKASAQSTGPDAAAPGGEAKDEKKDKGDGVIDAEFVDVDDKK
jgi:molecular chaperone DnaK